MWVAALRHNSPRTDSLASKCLISAWPKSGSCYSAASHSYSSCTLPDSTGQCEWCGEFCLLTRSRPHQARLFRYSEAISPWSPRWLSRLLYRRNWPNVGQGLWNSGATLLRLTRTDQFPGAIDCAVLIFGLYDGRGGRNHRGRFERPSRSSPQSDKPGIVHHGRERLWAGGRAQCRPGRQLFRKFAPE